MKCFPFLPMTMLLCMIAGISASTFCDNYTTTCGTISAWSDCKTDFVNINVGKGDKNADTQACRLYNLGLAEQSTDNAKAHCPHASKAGGGVCVDNATNFCARYTATCNNISAWSTCAADFAKFGAGSGTGNADTQACRLYHLSLAETSTDYAKTHCPHASKDGGKVCVEEEVVLKSQGVGNTSQSSFTLGMSDVGKCCTDSFTVISCPNEDEYPEEYYSRVCETCKGKIECCTSSESGACAGKHEGDHCHDHVLEVDGQIHKYSGGICKRPPKVIQYNYNQNKKSMEYRRRHKSGGGRRLSHGGHVVLGGDCYSDDYPQKCKDAIRIFEAWVYVVIVISVLVVVGGITAGIVACCMRGKRASVKEAGVMVAIRGTSQGRSGWYQDSDGKVFFFAIDAEGTWWQVVDQAEWTDRRKDFFLEDTPVLVCQKGTKKGGKDGKFKEFHHPQAKRGVKTWMQSESGHWQRMK